MEIHELKEDMELFSVTAGSFPHDIGAAFHDLLSRLDDPEGRVFFGISYLADNCEIIYKAAVLEKFKGEGEKLGCEPLLIKKGKYIAETVFDWKKDIGSIGAVFRKLSSRPDVSFPCIEWYKGEDVMCMIRLEPEKQMAADTQKVQS
jgi:hypothetical protein